MSHRLAILFSELQQRLVKDRLHLRISEFDKVAGFLRVDDELEIQLFWFVLRPLHSYYDQVVALAQVAVSLLEKILLGNYYWFCP